MMLIMHDCAVLRDLSKTISCIIAVYVVTWGSNKCDEHMLMSFKVEFTEIKYCIKTDFRLAQVNFLQMMYLNQRLRR